LLFCGSGALVDFQYDLLNNPVVGDWSILEAVYVESDETDTVATVLYHYLVRVEKACGTNLGNDWAGTPRCRPPPPAGDGFFYLIQGQNLECGLGELGRASDETVRTNYAYESCTGLPRTDAFAYGEVSVVGSIYYLDLTWLYEPDGTYEKLQESQVDPGEGLTSELDHRWMFDVYPGRLFELHVEGRHTAFTEPEEFVFDYSTDGGVTWRQVPQLVLTTSYTGQDLVAPLRHGSAVRVTEGSSMVGTSLTVA
jgi:hypothetical protein